MTPRAVQCLKARSASRVSPHVSPQGLSRAHVTPVPSACRSLGPSARHVDTARRPPWPVDPEAPRPHQAGRDATGPAALTKRGRGRPRPAERGRAHLLAAAMQGPGPWWASLSGFRAELEREVPDRVPGKEPHRCRRRRRRGLGPLSSRSLAARAGAGRAVRGGARAESGRDLCQWVGQRGNAGNPAGGLSARSPSAASFQLRGASKSPKLSKPRCPYM